MKAKPVEIDGARIVVTGASSGIGRALAVALAAKGARLMIVARRRHLLDELADEIETAGGARPHVVETDLSTHGSVDTLAASALALLGGVDVLINNAGTNVIGSQSVLGDSESARAVFETNFWTPLALTAALLPGMRSAGSGTIVNVTSTTQAVPIPLIGFYCSSKIALSRATQVLRLELARTPLRVLEVVPGSTDTDLLRSEESVPMRGPLPRRPKPVSPQSTARVVIRALERGDTRVVHPKYSVLPLELPFIGRLVGRIASRSIDSQSEVVIPHSAAVKA